MNTRPYQETYSVEDQGHNNIYKEKRWIKSSNSNNN